MQKKDGARQLSLFAQDGYAGRMCLEVFQAGSRRARISVSSCRSLQALAAVPFLSLDLRRGAGPRWGPSSADRAGRRDVETCWANFIGRHFLPGLAVP